MKHTSNLFGIVVLVVIMGFSITACDTGGGDEPLSDENVVTYPWPNGMTKFTTITMTADEKNIDLYSVRANNNRFFTNNPEEICDQVAVAMFDMAETVIPIEITVPDTVTSVIVRPLSSNITATQDGKKISFSVFQPGQYSVEWNNTANNPKNAVLIFANPKEKFSGTTVVEPGIHVQSYDVAAGKTLYLKPGAVVRGRVFLNSGSKVVGRGIIDGSHQLNWTLLGYNATLPIETYRANNVEIKGITIFDSNAWNVQLQDSSNVKIDNLKIVSSRCNSDGISIQSSHDITIQNSFIRTWDDGIVVKIYGNMDSYNITAKNVRMWTDLAQSLEIGFETNKGDKANPKIYGVTFEGIEIFHALHKAPVSIHNGDNAEIYDVVFKNITVENYQAGEGDGWNYIIDIANCTSVEAGGVPGWTSVEARGNIHDILIENVKILSGKTPEARFIGGQSGGRIYDFTVKDIYHETTKQDLSSYNQGPDCTITFF